MQQKNPDMGFKREKGKEEIKAKGFGVDGYGALLRITTSHEFWAPLS